MQIKKGAEHLCVLQALTELPFPCGKNLLIDILRGEQRNDSVIKHELHTLSVFGSLAYEKHELAQIIDMLLERRLVTVTPLDGKKYLKVLTLTQDGLQELSQPSLDTKKTETAQIYTPTQITESDKLLFSHFGFFLGPYDDFQKKAIICPANTILCIAGAGSGKTTVLTKRIEFLTHFKSAAPAKILAVTFTRKARSEMEARLLRAGVHGISVETFNSFCEKILTLHNNKIYPTPVRVITYGERLKLMKTALASKNIGMERALDIYFSSSQRRGKSPEELAGIFLNDCFMILDYFKTEGTALTDFYVHAPPSQQDSASLVYAVCREIDTLMKKHGLRDFADQLSDTLLFFEKYPAQIPRFDYILVDEFQDVNTIQVKLLDTLRPPNLFCVGDPRQSIFGWRGSNISYILDFEKKYPGCQIINLTKNYRSTKPIVEIINHAIADMRLPDLVSAKQGLLDAHLFEFDYEDEEYEWILEKIISLSCPRHEIFVLARTNRQLIELSERMKKRSISHIIRSDELRRTVHGLPNDVTLATVHAIKGLEANTVFVMGCTSANFPCKASDHPVIDVIKINTYDKEEEERRLFYVALSRARQTLYLSYTGYPSRFLTPAMKLRMIQQKNEFQKSL